MSALLMSILSSLFIITSITSTATTTTTATVPPKPSGDILKWSKLEIGMMYSYGMISTMTSTDNTQYFCIGVGGGGGSLPPPSTFNPTKIDIDNWLDAAVAIGAKYAVLVAQHCGGFSTWPTDVASEADGFEYKYSIKYSPLQNGEYDLVKEFIDSCKRHDVLPAIYYSLNQNYYLNVGRGKVLGPPSVTGQGNVTQDMYGRIVLAQMKELWGNYGPLTEIWFDGGCSVPGISANISTLLATLQPHAVYFGGCASDNNLRWVGTESGQPSYPIWSTNDGSTGGGCPPGLGDKNGNTFCPAESDTTLHSSGQWFWRPSFGIKTLDDLKTTYYKTVGQNTNLLLNAAPNNEGLIEEESMLRYKQFGEWIKACFGKPVIATTGKGNIIKLISAAGQPFRFNKIVIQEDQTNGQAVTQFSIYNPFYNKTTAIYSGQSIGNKVIINFDSTPWPSHELVLNITQSFIEPVITQFAAYNCIE